MCPENYDIPRPSFYKIALSEYPQNIIIFNYKFIIKKYHLSTLDDDKYM